MLPDAGPLITLAYANGLDLFKPGWPVEVVDMALEKLTRNTTLDSFCCRSRAPHNRRGPPVLSDPVSVGVAPAPPLARPTGWKITEGEQAKRWQAG